MDPILRAAAKSWPNFRSKFPSVMSELSSLVQGLMNDIDIKPLHPKHKLLLYSPYVLSKQSWHFTIAISKFLAQDNDFPAF